MIGRAARERGQSTVELVALAPVVFLCCLFGLQALVAGVNNVVADNAAHAGALAGELGHNPRTAARSAAPGWSTSQVEVGVHSERVRVTLRPRALFPGVAGLLVTHSEARYTR